MLNEVLKFNSDLEFTEVVDDNTLYFNYLNTSQFMFLGNKTQTMVLNTSEGTPVGTFEAPVWARKAGDKLYFPKGNVLHEIDISRFLDE